MCNILVHDILHNNFSKWLVDLPCSNLFLPQVYFSPKILLIGCYELCTNCHKLDTKTDSIFCLSKVQTVSPSCAHTDLHGFWKFTNQTSASLKFVTLTLTLPRLLKAVYALSRIVYFLCVHHFDKLCIFSTCTEVVLPSRKSRDTTQKLLPLRADHSILPSRLAIATWKKFCSCFRSFYQWLSSLLSYLKV